MDIVLEKRSIAETETTIASEGSEICSAIYALDGAIADPELAASSNPQISVLKVHAKKAQEKRKQLSNTNLLAENDF